MERQFAIVNETEIVPVQAGNGITAANVVWKYKGTCGVHRSKGEFPKLIDGFATKIFGYPCTVTITDGRWKLTVMKDMKPVHIRLTQGKKSDEVLLEATQKAVKCLFSRPRRGIFALFA